MTGNPDPGATLLVIDVQKGLDQPGRNNPAFESNLALLLAHWRQHRYPVVHVQHSSIEPGSPLRPELPGWSFEDVAQPVSGEPVYPKNTNSAFIGTSLEADLRTAGVNQVVIAGLTTNHCVSSTARMAANLGFRTFVVADATAAFGRCGPDGTHYSADQIHAVSLTNLHGEFATIIDTKSLLGD